MRFANRLLAGLVGGTVAALLCAAAVLRQLSAQPDDAMTAAGMALMLIWPILIVSVFVPERGWLAWAVVTMVGLAALAAGWGIP